MAVCAHMAHARSNISKLYELGLVDAVAGRRCRLTSGSPRALRAKPSDSTSLESTSPFNPLVSNVNPRPYAVVFYVLRNHRG